jgi:hypothetical protein
LAVVGLVLQGLLLQMVSIAFFQLLLLLVAVLVAHTLTMVLLVVPVVEQVEEQKQVGLERLIKGSLGETQTT